VTSRYPTSRHEAVGEDCTSDQAALRDEGTLTVEAPLFFRKGVVYAVLKGGHGIQDQQRQDESVA
jgi:hypothetical protein